MINLIFHFLKENQIVKDHLMIMKKKHYKKLFLIQKNNKELKDH